MVTALIGSIAFLVITILYVLLVLGLPFGEFAMGGKYRVMPKQMRVACAVSVVIQAAAVVALLRVGGIIAIGWPQGLAKGICYFFAAYLCFNTIMNALSKSNKEKYVMTPLSLVTAVCFWLTAANG